MMRWVTASSVRLAGLVIAVAVGIATLGVVQLRSAPVDTYPEFMPPMVQLRTEALGLSAAEVEQLITVPLEQDLLNGIPWLDQIRSESMTGLSSVDLVFEPGTDVLKARQMVQERLTQVAGLPNVGSRPAMLQPLSSTSRVMMIGLSSDDLSLIDMSVLARWKIRPRLMGIPGVANVAIWGQRDRQLQVEVNPDRLAAEGIALNRVVNSTGNALWSSPLTFVEASTPGTGGFIDTANQRFGVQHMMPITTPEQLGAVTIEDTSGRTLRLRDIAQVVEDHQPLIGDAQGPRRASLILVIQKFPDADTLQVTRNVENAMASMRPGLSGIHIDTKVFRPASFLESALRNVGLAVSLALLLILLVLAAFTRSWRATLIAFAAIPVSLVTAAYVLYLRGTTFNSMTLAGLAVALGVVVGDAVIDTDNIQRRVRSWRASRSGDSVAEPVVEASHQVRHPLLYATLVLLLIAVPLLVQGGVAGSFSREIALSYVVAVLASMVVALTLTPALSALLLRHGAAEPRTGILARAVRRGFDRTAPRFLSSPPLAYASVGVLVLVGLAAVPQLHGDHLLPASHDRDMLVRLRAVPGTSLQEMDRITGAISREVDAIRGIRGVGVHVGRAVASDQVADVDSAELWFSVAPSADRDATVDQVRRVVNGYPGLSREVSTYEQEQLALSDTHSTRPLVVRVFGQDLPTLRAQAAKVRAAIAYVDGVRDPRVEAQPEEPTLQVQVDLAKAERNGIRPGDVRRTAATLLSGLLVGNLYEDQKVFDVVVWGSPDIRQNPSSVANVMIDTPSGDHVRLKDVASVRMVPSPRTIRHEDVSRYVDVTADVSGQSIGSVRDEVDKRIQTLRYPLEYHAEVLGAAYTRQGVGGRALGLGAAALVGVFLLLQALTRSWRTAGLLLVLVPLGVVGGVVTAPFVGGLWSAGAFLGLLAVLAVGTRNAILLVQCIQRRRSDSAAGEAPAVLDGTRDVLVPVVLSAATFAAAVLPFVLLGNVAGEEILRPLAVVVLGGLVTSTLLTLFVLPSLYQNLVGGGAVHPPIRTGRTTTFEEVRQ